MADYLSEEEQIESMKKWWDENGKQILVGAGLALLVVSGYQFWKAKKTAYTHEASAIYEQVQQLSQNGQSFESLADKLKSDYSKSVYAQFAAMLKAKKAVDANNMKLAAKELEWAVNNSNDEYTDDLAALRLTRVQLAQNEVDAALKSIVAGEKGIYASQFLELKGDALLKKKDSAGAKQAYELAVENTQDKNFISPILRYKLQSLGGTIE